MQARLDTSWLQNPGVTKAWGPAELLPASGSGLDPYLSPKAAAVQVAHGAKVCRLAVAKMQALVAQHTNNGLPGP
ncbi:potassium-transporting ATPase subunit C [Hymenobacter elongatus]